LDWAQPDAVIGRCRRSKRTSISATLFGLALIAIGIATGSSSLFPNLLTPPHMADWLWSLAGQWQDVTSDL
jgi:hypothetical protein